MFNIIYLTVLISLCTTLKYGAAQYQASNPRYIEVNTPISMHLSEGRVVALRVAGLRDNAISFILLQVHTHQTEVTVSLTALWTRGHSTRGPDVGVIAMVDINQTAADFFVNASADAQAVVMATAYMSKSPVPGGCNMEFPLELDPNMQITWDDNEVTITFQYANFGSPKGGVPARCESTERQSRLTYDVYQYFLPGRDWRETTYLDAITNLIRPDQLRQKTVKVKTVEYHKGLTRVRFAAYPGQGVVFGVIVNEQSLNNNTLTAAYVPISTYTCNFTKEDQCEDLSDFPLQILSCILGSFGLMLCFAGHRFFKFSMFTFGLLAFGIVGYILLARYAPLTSKGVLMWTVLCGLGGGFLWLLFWCLVGVPVLSVLLAGLVLGFSVSSVIFNLTPLGLLNTFNSDFNYGMAFACGVLILPVVLLAFTKKLSLISCTMVGSFLVLAAADSFLHSNVTYVVLNAIRKGAIPGYIQTVGTIPLQMTGVLLLVSWGVLVLLGLIAQSFAERDRPDFPACPYDRFRERQQRRRQMAELAGSRGADEERQRLLGAPGRPGRRRHYGRPGSVQQFQETPPGNDSPPPSYNRVVDPL